MAALKNSKHEVFARAILEGMSGRDAYLAAGYGSASPAAADAAASRLLRSGKVAARVAELKANAARASTVTAARVIDELGKIAFSNMGDYMRVGPDRDPVLDFSKLTRDQMAALVEVTVDDFKAGRGGDARDVRRVRFKLADKRAALVDLGKHLGMFKERIEHSGPDGGPIQAQPVAPPMVPREVALAVRKLIGGAEVAVGLPPGSGSDAERLKAIVATGEPLPPDLYESVSGAGKSPKTVRSILQRRSQA
jgi:phage terminase small subunit